MDGDIKVFFFEAGNRYSNAVIGLAFFFDVIGRPIWLLRLGALGQAVKQIGHAIQPDSTAVKGG